MGRAAWRNNFNNNANANANDDNINNHNGLREIAQYAGTFIDMVYCRDVWQEVCRYENLEQAYKKARKHKTKKPYVLDFEKQRKNNLTMLRLELLFHAYKPKPLETFIIRDPKTRKISKSDFRDRVIHHALCNIIGPLFEKSFIHDSYANRRGKGTSKAIERFEYFQKKVTKNATRQAFVLKADIRHYFDEVDQRILLQILQKKVKDPQVGWLIKKILGNYMRQEGKGMPLGNLTSQFFANVYLNELDQFVKHHLKVKFYLRYVDDFVILHQSQEELRNILQKINFFLQEKLCLQLHPTKSYIVPLHEGTEFLGLKFFLHHKIMKKKNIRRFYQKLDKFCTEYDAQKVAYDKLYDFLEGWLAYAKNANTFNRRSKVYFFFEEKFKNEVSYKEVNRLRRESKNTGEKLKISEENRTSSEQKEF